MNKNYLPSHPLEQLSTEPTRNFEYSILDVETRAVVQKFTNEIKMIMRRTSRDIIDTGQKLIEVKQYLGHGNFIRWLKSEFNWSVSTATKFMQVAEQFKFVTFTNLNITASALYLIAAPSTPTESRAEALNRASLGENISYTKAREIICKHKKTAKSKPKKLISVDVSTKTTERNSCTSIKTSQLIISDVFYAVNELTEKEAQTETCSLLSKNSLPFVVFEDHQTVTTIKGICYATEQISTYTENSDITIHEISDALTTELAISIKKLTPEQLSLAITKSVNIGLSKDHLKALIGVSQKVLNSGN